MKSSAKQEDVSHPSWISMTEHLSAVPGGIATPLRHDIPALKLAADQGIRDPCKPAWCLRIAVTHEDIIGRSVWHLATKKTSSSIINWLNHPKYPKTYSIYIHLSRSIHPPISRSYNYM